MARGYAPDAKVEGATASSAGFKYVLPPRPLPFLVPSAYASCVGGRNREQAEEGAYARRQDAAKLAKLREQLAKNEQEKVSLLSTLLFAWLCADPALGG